MGGAELGDACSGAGWWSLLRFQHPGFVSFFEIVIRGLGLLYIGVCQGYHVVYQLGGAGGLLSAHALSGTEVFLRKAKELGERLLKAFNQQTGSPALAAVVEPAPT